MLQFWCLSQSKWPYHGSFREDMGSAFCDFGVSYRSLIRQMQVFKKGTSEMLQFWCLSPVRVAYHGSFREDMGSAFCDFGVSYRSLIRQMQVFKKGTSEMLQFWCLSPVRVAYHGSFRENLESAFWGLGLSYHTLIKHMQVFKTQHLKCCSFDASPQSEWLITAHLERIWSQHFGALGCHITSWLSTSKSPKRSSWNVAVLMPLPVKVAYHGSSRENLGSAFCDFGVSYRSLIRQMQRFKKGTSEMLQFWCLSPVRVAYHGSFRENLESAFWGLGLSYHNLMKCMRVFEPV